VHLSGWLAMGWRVAGGVATAGDPSVGSATAAAPELIATPGGDTCVENDAKPAPTRGRRGRRRKDEATASAAAEPSPATGWQPEPGTTPGIDGAHADSDGEPAGGESSSQSDLDAGPDADPAADAPVEPDPAPAESPPDPEDALTSLPDDLFNDPLI